MPSNILGIRSKCGSVSDPEKLYVFAATISLWISIYISRKLFAWYPVQWIVLPLLLALLFIRSDFMKFEVGNRRLLQLIGTLSSIYSVTHYPLMPLSGNPDTAEVLYVCLLAMWVASVLSGIFCYRYPSLAVLAPAFLVWSKYAATVITGLHHNETLDVQPLSDVACCLMFGLAINRLLGRLSLDRADAPAPAGSFAVETFAKIALVTAISIHLANYYWSFVAKASLDGDPISWLLNNDASNIFLVATDNNHVLFSGYTEIVQLIYSLIHIIHLPVNFFVFFIQGLAVVGFLLPKKGLVLLVVAYDIMHIMIVILAGANFWPWIFLNVAVAFIISSNQYLKYDWRLGIYSSAFILLAHHIVNPAYLGWFDTKANNRMVFEAIDRTGKRYYVPTNFFTFYSYPMGWMAYGAPGSADAFWIGSPNGGAGSLWKARAADDCDAELLRKPDPFYSSSDRPLDERDLGAFLKGYQALVLRVSNAIGGFPYNYYPHHFYDKTSSSNDGFSTLDKRDIVAYVYRRESVCLTMVDGAPRRRVISSAEYRVDVP